MRYRFAKGFAAHIQLLTHPLETFQQTFADAVQAIPCQHKARTQRAHGENGARDQKTTRRKTDAIHRAHPTRFPGTPDLISV